MWMLFESKNISSIEEKENKISWGEFKKKKIKHSLKETNIVKEQTKENVSGNETC